MRVVFGEYQLDTETRTLQREGRRISVQSKAFDLLAYLIERRERVVSSDELLDALWPGLHVTPAALSTAVQKARQAVGDNGEHQAVLHTEHGKGFRFVAEVTDLSPQETIQPTLEATQQTPETAQSGSIGAIQISLVAELKRRNVFRVAAAYGIVALLLVKVASVVLPALRLPEWTLTSLVFFVVAGFPLVLILAWAFELTPEGIKLEKTVVRTESITQQTGRKLDFAIIGLLGIAVIFMFVDNYVLNAEPEQLEVNAEQVLVPEQAPAAESVTRAQSIAVLPFVNMSADPDQEYFANGISEELLNTLAQFEDLRVVGRTSSFSFKHSDADLKQIGKALSADVILEGSVRMAGDRVRITAQLNDAKDGFQLWSDAYDRELTDIFAIQMEIATAIAGALRVSLTSEDRERLATAPTQNLEAYQAYLLGKQRQAKFTIASIEESIEYFQQAIELDPKFALAYVWLSFGYVEQLDSDLPRDELLARAQAAADKALELDDRLAEAHVALGWVKVVRNDFEGAEAAYQHALALDPNSVDANLLYGDLLGLVLARYEEALALRRKAVELDPLSLEIVPRLGEDLNKLGRFDEALAWYERALEIDPSLAYGHRLIGEHHWQVSGRLDEAVVWYTKSAALDPGRFSALANFGRLFLDLGDPDQADYWINRTIELGPEGFDSNSAMQALALYRGDEAAAERHGRKAFAISPLEAPVLTLLRDHEVRAGRYTEARALYEEHYPELLSERDPKVDLRNYQAAIDLALILSRTGEQERADLLLDRSLQQIQRRPRLGSRGYGIADVKIYALQGDNQKALSALRQAIDEGWRSFWWYFLKQDPTLESLHDEPEYQAMVAEIEVDMAEQLERVREMERNGELELIPEVSATSH